MRTVTLLNFKLSRDELDAVQNIRCRVEENSIQIDEIVKTITDPYCKDLDRYVSFIRDCLKDGENPPTTQELEDFCLNLSTYIYFACGMTEYLGIRDDIGRAVYKEMYNTSRNSLTKGTVADKDSLAALHSQEEFVISSAYTRAYKIMKSKIESAQDLLASAKKVLSHRIQQEELTNLGGN